jgi:anthranilate synthase component 1
MEIIDELETTRRGIYGGCIGYADYRGNMDSCIGIRTLVIRNGKAYVQAGGGIVADSDPEMEYQECLNKAAALFRAIDMAENGELTVPGQEGAE